MVKGREHTDYVCRTPFKGEVHAIGDNVNNISLLTFSESVSDDHSIRIYVDIYSDGGLYFLDHRIRIAAELD